MASRDPERYRAKIDKLISQNAETKKELQDAMAQYKHIIGQDPYDREQDCERDLLKTDAVVNPDIPINDANNGIVHQAQTENTNSLKAQTSETDDKTEAERQILLKHARATVDSHIKALTRYNEIKDSAMRLLEMLADYEQKTLREILEERDVHVE